MNQKEQLIKEIAQLQAITKDLSEVYNHKKGINDFIMQINCGNNALLMIKHFKLHQADCNLPEWIIKNFVQELFIFFQARLLLKQTELNELVISESVSTLH